MLREKISGRLIAALAAALLLTGCGKTAYVLTENTQPANAAGETFETFICDGRVCGGKDFGAGRYTEKKAPAGKPRVRKTLVCISSILGLPVIIRADKNCLQRIYPLI